MAKTTTSELPILIIGAGPAGLALAQGLRKRQIPYRIFERDEDSSVRTQGWAVAIQQAKLPLLGNIPNDLPPLEITSHLHNVGLKGSFAGYDGLSGEKYYGMDESDTFFRADRLKLRDWLLTNINVEWNKKFDKYLEDETGVTAYFKDGTSARGCILVGAEGFNSDARSQLVPGAKATPSNMDTMLGKLTVTRDQDADFSETMARSIGVIQLPDVFLFTGLHRISDDGQHADWYWMLSRPQTDAEKGRSISDWTPEQLYRQAVEWLEPMHPKFKDIIKLTKPEDCLVMPEFSSIWYPPENGFSTDKVTLIGDAAHKMPPLGGQGMNNAFLDTIELCEFLMSEETTAKALKAYDNKVSVRGREAIKGTLRWPLLP